jgi:hypothetical protein
MMQPLVTPGGAGTLGSTGVAPLHNAATGAVPLMIARAAHGLNCWTGVVLDAATAAVELKNRAEPANTPTNPLNREQAIDVLLAQRALPPH